MLEPKETVMTLFVDSCKEEGIPVPELIRFEENYPLAQQVIYFDKEDKRININMMRIRGCKTPEDFAMLIFEEYKKLVEEKKENEHIVI